MSNEFLFDPLKQYKNVYKDLHNKNTKNYFNDLVKKSNINISENKDTVKKIERYNSQKDNVKKQLSRLSWIRLMLIILSIFSLFGIYYMYMTLNTYESKLVPIIFLISFIIMPVLFFYLIFGKINPFIKNLLNDENFLIKELRKLHELAWEQMKPLNSLFTDRISSLLFKKTIPLINMDKMFDSKRFDYLVNKFKLGDTYNENRSTLFVQSGDINGNPFYIANDLVHNLGTKTWTGTRTISWTTYVTVNGKRQAQRRTQTLVATLDKPHPYYVEQSYVVYGNEAAPNLIFSRTDSDAEIMSEKQISKTVRREEKLLAKKSRKAIKKGDNYTLMGNTEFEVFFGATNRNNEVEFRLLFTPLAQKQLLDLMKDKEIGYGDNFDFTKHKMINILYPEHLDAIKLDVSVDFFYHYDYEVIEKRFIDYNNEFFKAIYFAFAPIIAIPIYQQHKPHEYIYKDLYNSNVSFYEHEVVANKFNEKQFKHPLAQTRSILKTSVVSSDSTKDVIKVKAHSYETKNRTDYVSKLGGDGKLHMVPVHWVEFIPVIHETTVEVDILDEEKQETYTDKVRKIVDKINNREELTDKEVYLTSKFIGRIIK